MFRRMEDMVNEDQGKDEWVERWTSEWKDSGAAEQSWVLPSYLRSVCLCRVWGRLRGGCE